MNPPSPTPWFDAHLDLPYLALHGRDMLAPASEATGGDLPAALTFHSMRHGNIRYALGTIFINPGMPDAPYGYIDASDTQRAHDRAVAQMRLYHQWESQNIIQIVRTKADLTDEFPDSGGGPIKIIILMEGADGIRTPAQAQWWFNQGLRACSLTWVKGSRYATGDGTLTHDTGLTAQGRDLVKAFDALKITHDISHLSDQSASDLLSLSTKPVIASHSASRTLQGDPKRMRHISDELARAVASTRGVIGLPLYTRFLTTDPSARASIPRTCDHIDHLASITGSRTHIGLGSDLDGGFSANDLPQGIQSPSDYHKLTTELSNRHWSPTDLTNFQSQNWLRFFQANLP
jgi:membrane dipeptidase